MAPGQDIKKIRPISGSCMIFYLPALRAAALRFAKLRTAGYTTPRLLYTVYNLPDIFYIILAKL